MRRTKYGYFLTINVEGKQVAFGYYETEEALKEARVFVKQLLKDGYDTDTVQAALGLRKNNTDDMTGFSNDWIKVLFESERIRGYRTYTCACKYCGHLQDVRSSVLRANPDHSLKCGCKMRAKYEG